MQKKDICAYIKKHAGIKTAQECADATGCHRGTIFRYAKELGVSFTKPKDSTMKPSEAVQEDKKKLSAEYQKRFVEDKYKLLLKENLELQKTVAIKQEMYPLKLCRIDTPKKGESESVAFALASDWHLEQEVRRDEIIYNNQYNLEIAEARAKEFFTNTLDLIRRQQEDQVIKTLVLWLGGDFITSNIHTELLKICKLGPAQAICFARDLLISGINFILENSELNLIIPFNFGNHSRIVEKNWSSNEEDNSLEYILYDDITLHFKNNPRVVMVPPTGGTATIEVYGMKIGFVHGHREFKFKGGVGGLYVPVRSKIKDKFSPIGYDLIILGHFHSFIQDTLFLCNGSMIGYDQYANCKGFRAESPKQTFFVISSKWKCRTATYPILFSK